ncbi:MAG: CHAT domain-containing protein [Pirellulales bacterium]
MKVNNMGLLHRRSALSLFCVAVCAAGIVPRAVASEEGPFVQKIKQAENEFAECERMRGPLARETLDAQLLLGALYARAANFIRAQEILSDCLARSRKTPAQDAVFLANVLNSVAGIRSTVGRHEEAMRDFEEARKLLKPHLSDPHDLALPAALEACAVSLDGEGTVLARQGKYHESILMYEKAIESWNQLGRKLPQDDPRRPDAQAGLFRTSLSRAAVFASQGKDTIRVKGKEHSLEVPLDLYYEVLLKKLKRDLTPEHPCVAAACNALAERYLGMNRADLAEKRAVEARAIAERTGNLLEHLRARHTLLVVHYRLKQPETAIREWKDLLDDCTKHQLDAWAARTLRRLGDDCLGRNALQEAEMWYRQSAETLDRTGVLPNARYNAWVGLAITYQRQGNAQAALASLQKALRIIEVAAAETTGGDVGYDRYAAQFAGAYDMLIGILLDQSAEQASETALYRADALRARLLDVALQRSGVGLSGRWDGQALDRLATARKTLQQRELQARQSGRVSGVAAETNRTLGDIEEAIFLEDVRRHDADPARRRLLGKRAERGDFLDTLASLRRQHPVILYYYLGAQQSYVWVITRESVLLRKLTISPDNALGLGVPSGPLTRAVADQLVATYVESIAQPDLSGKAERGHSPAPGSPWPARRNSHPAALAEQGAALTETLLPQDILAQMRTADHVTIVPDGPLYGLPFHALPVAADVEYVADVSGPIAYAPSIATLATLQTRARDEKVRDTVVTVGSNWLEGAYEECRHLSGLCRRAELPHLALLGTQATKSGLRESAPKCRLLHIASHAVSQSELDNYFGLIDLYKDDLAVHEIPLLDFLGCEAAVLSACETNVGSTRYLGVGNSAATAFLAAGSTRVICSYWRVNDRATQELMSHFFDEVVPKMAEGHGVNYAAALHQATRRLRDKNPQWRSPYYWAPFALIGPAKSVGTE